MKTILSLFDYSGNWPKYYRENGYEVIQVDIKHEISVLDIVKDGETGWVSAPTPKSLASIFDTVFENPELATKLGIENKSSFLRMGFNWENIIRKLLA